MIFRHRGQFSLIDPGTRPAAVVLRHASTHDERAEAVFGRVTKHDLPATLDGVAIRRGSPPDQSFVVSSAGRDYRVVAGSLRIHEGVALYARVLPQAHFSARQRLLWTVLLWAARFTWGQALIRRVRG
jgi:hypothetical protein